MPTALTPRTPLRLPPRASVLIILMGSLGDLVRGLCLPAEIKRNWPQTRVTWLVEPGWKSLLDTHPHIDEILVFDRPRKMAAVADLRRALRRRRFDVTLDLQRHFKSGLFSYLSGAPLRIGVHPRNAKEFNWVFNNHHLPYFSPRRPKLDHYLAFLAGLGAPLPSVPEFGLCIQPTCRRPDHLAAILPPSYIVVVMGSSWISKDWTQEGYQGLLARILADGRHGVVLVGDSSQTAAAGRLEQAMASEHLLNLTGRTSLPELAAILANAAAAVGPDSGPGHISAAVGTPYVALFGPTDPDRVAPFRCAALVVRADSGCSECYRKRCRYKDRPCMAAITPAMVMPKLEQALRTGRLF